MYSICIWFSIFDPVPGIVPLQLFELWSQEMFVFQ